MNDLIQTLLRESWNTTAAHWRALLAGTAISSLVGTLAILPMLPLLFTPESDWQPLDAAWRILLVIGLTAIPALAFETWIAGLAEARRTGETVDHRRILDRSLRALPAAAGATFLLHVVLIGLIALAFVPLFATTNLGPVATLLSIAILFVGVIAAFVLSMALPGILSVACAVAYAEDAGPIESFRRTLRIFSTHGRAALNLSLLAAILASVFSLPLLVVLLPLMFIGSLVFAVGNALTAAGIVALLILAVVGIHGIHTAQSIVTSHIYPVMRHHDQAN